MDTKESNCTTSVRICTPLIKGNIYYRRVDMQIFSNQISILIVMDFYKYLNYCSFRYFEFNSRNKKYLDTAMLDE